MLGTEFATLVVHWFTIQLLSVLIIFCAKRKQERTLGQNGSQTKVNIGQTAGRDTPKATSNQPSPAKEETPRNKDEDEDDVKFNINIKKPEEKKDEFDDDEENPLARITLKPKNKNGKKNAGTGQPGQLKTVEKNPGKAVKTKEEIGPERAILGPNEKQIGVSCYQFEPSTQQPTAPKKATAPMQKSTDGGPRTAGTRTVATAPTAPTAPSAPPTTAAPAASTPIPASSANLISTIDTNTKSTLSLTKTKKAKSLEQDRTNKEPAVEKTQKADGEAK